jgi:HK97 family phage prohead protease
MKEIVFKNYEANIKDLDINSSIVTGYFSTWDTIDYDGDVMERGCFTKTINERFAKNQIKYLWQHDTYKPLGKLNVLVEDDKGLYFEAKMSDTSYGLDALKLYRDGVIDQHSIGFITIKSIEEQNSEDVEITRIKEVKLFEGSAVTFGANEKTPFTGFKGYTPQERDDRIKLLVKSIKNGDYTDETFDLIEYELLKLVTLVKSEEPIKPTTEENEPIQEDNNIQEIKLFRNLLNL